jgi:hypothetical protein
LPTCTIRRGPKHIQKIGYALPEDVKEERMRKIATLVGIVALMTVQVTSVALARGHQCAGRPCIGTNTKNVLIERRGNGVSDGIYGRGGRDVLRAGRYTRDTDRLHGNRGRDRLIVLDGDMRD